MLIIERKLTNVRRHILDNFPSVLNLNSDLVNVHTFCLVWDAIISITEEGKQHFIFDGPNADLTSA